MNTSPLNLSLPRGCLAACLLAAAAAILQAAEPSEPRTVRIDDGDTVGVSAGAGSVAFELTLSLAPAADSAATLDVMRGVRAEATAPLRRIGNVWRAEVPAAHLGHLLTADQLVARFPSTGGRPLHLAIPRDRFLPRLEPAASLVGDAPLFFDAPKAPARPGIPGAEASRADAEAFLASAWVFDQAWAAYAYRFSSARADANALFRDLITSGRLPWTGAPVERQNAAFEKLRVKQEELARERAAWQELVRAFVQRWNAAHPGAEPLTISFGSSA